MKEVTGRILSWDDGSKLGTIKSDDGAFYQFTSKEWMDEQPPEVGGEVLAICENGREPSEVEYLRIEHIPFLKIATYSEGGEVRTISHTRFIGGPRRMLSDALVWMQVAKGLHNQNAHMEIADISSLLTSEHPRISLHGSVIKYCYGFSIEMYLKWILVEAHRKYRPNHNLRQLVGRLPDPVLDRLRDIYSDYREQYRPRFRMREAHVHGVEELGLGWSTFNVFIYNLDKQKFIVGRYAEPSEYGTFRSRSRKRSREMNSYIASDDFFALGEKILAYGLNPATTNEATARR